MCRQLRKRETNAVYIHLQVLLSSHTIVYEFFCWKNVKSPFSFWPKTQIVTAKKFQNHIFQKSISPCVFTFPLSSLMFPKPCYTSIWGGWAVQGWTLRISPLLSPGSPDVRFVKAENRKAKFAKSHIPGSRAVCSQLAIAPCSIKLANSPHASSADSSIQFFAKTSSHRTVQFW